MILKYHDIQKLSEVELLSLTLREPADSQVVRGLLCKINTIEELLHITIQEMEEIDGMKTEPAESFLAGMELVKRIYAAPSRVKEQLNSPDIVAEFLMPQMRYLDREVFKCLYLNRKNCLKFVEDISIGGLTSSIVHAREVFKPAVKRSAASIILAHNHPSGDPSPSKEDIEVTKRLVSAGQVLGISIMDHIIVGDNRWVSLKQSGQMN